MKKWKTLQKHVVFDNKWMTVRRDTVELPNGKIVDDFYVWDGMDVVMIVPITFDNKLILVKQYKHGVDDFVIEYPAGYIENKGNIIDEAKRELIEETGYTTDTIYPITKFTVNPSKATGIVTVFVAENAKKTSSTNFDPNEDIETLVLSTDEVMKMIHSGEIWNASVIAATYLLLDRLKKTE